MDQRQKSALRKNHITLADQLILDEDFFAQLRQIKIFSEGMISIIKRQIVWRLLRRRVTRRLNSLHTMNVIMRRNHVTQADQLILDEDFFAQLRQIKIFSEGMISIIKAETKPRNQVYKMLELLEKRGPHAFGNFISILRENFWWVADKLEETYQEKMEAAQADRQDFQMPPSRQEYNERPRKLQRAVSTPLQSRVPRPVPVAMHASASTGQLISQQERTFRESFQADCNVQPTEYCEIEDEIDGASAANNFVASAGDEIEPEDVEYKNDETRARNYVDKSLSPIHILESRPKKVSDAMCSPEPVLDEEAHVDLTNTDNEVQNELNTQAEEPEEDINIDEDDDVDGNEDIVDTGASPKEGFESSETFYDSIRAESVFEDNDTSFYTNKLDDDDDAVAADGGEDNHLRAASSQSSLESELLDREDEEIKAIREIYLKLQWLIDEENKMVGSRVSEEESMRHIDELGITFQMIIDKLDELITQKQGSDVQKVLATCYKFFDDKDKKLPLYTCIQKLRDSKNELNCRLLEEMRKTNEMAHDMYLHSQDMKNLEKLKAKINKSESDNSELRDKLELSDKSKTEQTRRISELETKLYNLEELRKEEKKAQRRTGISPKRGQMNAGLTPRGTSKQPLYPDPRMAIMQTGYQTTKPSPRTQASTSAWRQYKK